LGYTGVIYANLALRELRRKGHIGDALNLVADFSELQRPGAQRRVRCARAL